jgi:hypothetical protein
MPYKTQSLPLSYVLQKISVENGQEIRDLSAINLWTRENVGKVIVLCRPDKENFPNYTVTIAGDAKSLAKELKTPVETMFIIKSYDSSVIKEFVVPAKRTHYRAPKKQLLAHVFA